MKNKQQIKELLDKALDLLKKQTLNSEELKIRSQLNFAIKALVEADDDDGPKSQAV
jgi:hypothetical protein